MTNCIGGPPSRRFGGILKIMCLAIPSKVIHIKDSMATIDVYGARRDISLLLMPAEIRIGDYVLVHAGFAIQRVDEEAAAESLSIIKEILTDSDSV